jgi:hypothetical protein
VSMLTTSDIDNQRLGSDFGNKRAITTTTKWSNFETEK